MYNESRGNEPVQIGAQSVYLLRGFTLKKFPQLSSKQPFLLLNPFLFATDPFFDNGSSLLYIIQEYAHSLRGGVKEGVRKVCMSYSFILQ